MLLIIFLVSEEDKRINFMEKDGQLKKITTFKDIEEYINSIPQYMEFSGVERSLHMLDELGHPEEKLKIIHVAGTNGKGSVCSYLNEILIANGYKTGLFTSPHLVDIRERIRINSQYISKEHFKEHFNRIYEIDTKLKKTYTGLAYFDYLLGIALCEFADENVDYVILETGLGGKLDSTNAIKHPVLSVITTISLEHMAVLGDSIEKIASEKAGIIKSGVPVVYSCKDKKVKSEILKMSEKFNSLAVGVKPKDYQIIKNTAKSIDFSLDNEYYKNDCFVIDTVAEYQVENASIALTASAVLNSQGIIKLDSLRTKQAVKEMHWEGRMEEVLNGVYVDGAHNPEGINALTDTVRRMSVSSCTLLFSVVKDKNFESMIKTLCDSGLFNEFIVTHISGDRQLSEEEIKGTFAKYTNVPVRQFAQINDAFLYGLSRRQGILICTGSLYLVGNIKSIICRMK